MSETDDQIAWAKTVLKAAGYVVHKDKSWRQLLERVRVAEALRHMAEEDNASTDRWVRQDLHPEIRRLRDRCTFLYGEARARGATVEELRQ